MFTNKFYKFVVFALVLFFSFSFVNFTKADDTLPDNVKISTSPDGNNTTVTVNSKPGYSTSVSTSCTNGKCTHKATSTKITSADIKKMQDSIKKQQEEMQKFWQMQNDLFKEQQKMFQDLWGTNLGM